MCVCVCVCVWNYVRRRSDILQISSSYPLFSTMGKAVVFLSLQVTRLVNLAKADENGNFQDIEMQDTMETFSHLLSVYWRSHPKHKPAQCVIVPWCCTERRDQP